jgi:hypothetical protein
MYLYFADITIEPLNPEDCSLIQPDVAKRDRMGWDGLD